MSDWCGMFVPDPDCEYCGGRSLRGALVTVDPYPMYLPCGCEKEEEEEEEEEDDES